MKDTSKPEGRPRVIEVPSWSVVLGAFLHSLPLRSSPARLIISSSPTSPPHTQFTNLDYTSGAPP